MRRQRLAALALLPVLALGLPACGDDGKAAASGTAKAAGDQDKMRKFAQCMRENGVDMKDPSGDGPIEFRAGGPGKGKGDGPGTGELKGVEAAQKKCAYLMPNGGKPHKAKPEDVAKQRVYSRCMREHGIASFPDPDPEGGLKIKVEKGGSIDPESQAFKDADGACRKFGPKGGPGGGGGS
ncbi:hypothetical protein [Actinomadura roseirufa]|uniref:hypothetical protein n=1 Tax=Actinomadura roseirufa TaxID=2094049 RepID=UPI001040F3A5|nr:hypothetical protein [Actinomadura roseirufa]